MINCIKLGRYHMRDIVSWKRASGEFNVSQVVQDGYQIVQGEREVWTDEREMELIKCPHRCRCAACTKQIEKMTEQDYVENDGAECISCCSENVRAIAHLKFTSLTNLMVRTLIGGQFGWGGTLLKRYQQGPKVSSDGLEIHRRV